MSSDGVGDDGSHAEFHSGKHTEDVSEGNVDKKNRERNVSDNLHGNNSAYPLNSRKKEEMKRRTHELERSHSDDKHGEFEKGQPWLDITVERNLNSRGREGKATHGEAHARPSRQPGQMMCSRSKPFAKGYGRYCVLNDAEDEEVPRKASVLLPILEDIERIFHDLVASGDVCATRLFLQNHPNFNINCVNYQKISALHVAVKQQNEAVVEYLLEQRGLDISDCTLYAIKGGNIKIIEMIFDKIREVSPALEFAGTTHSVDFADDLTPLILAAQLGNYETIDFLLKRGHSIPPVHPPFCKCESCKADLKKYDRLKYSTMKLNLYKAICNPMYIFHTRDDPFQRAFELTKELEDAATVFPQFKVSFQELWENLRTFTVDLIGCCRNAQEVEIILKKSPKSVADHIKFPRLQYAIDLKQKEFVSHPYTQAVSRKK
ncbi:hypothetical protein RUM44_003234 [Polyplax serrata]|uniref:Transient receptor ion channel domain-containing protein n=1 Tax=Polyplax serrata TaxID=468196 RepID=A0ABR1AXY0_POLSC